MEHQNLNNEILNELDEYEDIFTHHVDTILKSRLLLDEDAVLLTNCWDDRCCFKRRKSNKWDIFMMCLAVVSIVKSMKQKVYLVFSVPLVSRLCIKGYKSFRNYKVKRDFETLVKCFASLQNLNQACTEYYNTRVVNITFCSTSFESFMNYFYCVLLMILEEMKNNILFISAKIPFTEPFHRYIVNWDLEQFKSNDFNDYKRTLLNLDKMCDFYVLMVSSFLSCVGLSLCVNLWQCPTCDFRVIFEKIVPSTLQNLEKSVDKLVFQFNQLRHTLGDKKENNKKDIALVTRNYNQLHKPLERFLSHLQITFEIAKLLENNLKSSSSVKAVYFSQLVTELSSQFEICNENLYSFVTNYEIIIKRSLSAVPKAITDKDEQKIEQTENVDGLTESCNKLENLEDEEYNLYIGYSEDEEDDNDIVPSVDYMNQMPTEYLELMLTELRRKLEERKKQKQSNLNTAQSIDECDVEGDKQCGTNNENCDAILQNETNSNMARFPPPPPLPSKMKILTPLSCNTPTLESPTEFLNNVKYIAKQLNRHEETFEFGSSSSDSEND